jgi:TRAP-type C4-dicarboxylate transport system permease small subunit
MKKFTMNPIEKSKWIKVILIPVKALMKITNLLIAVILFVSVILRFCFKTNIAGYEEILAVCAFWLYFMGSAYGSFENSHIRADMIEFIKNEKLKRILKLIALILVVVANVVVINWAYEFVAYSLIQGQISTSLDMPLWVVKGAILVGLVYMLIFNVYHCIYAIASEIKERFHQKYEKTEVE